MMNAVRYGKPSMTDLPAELGVRIFKQILSTPPIDYDQMKKRSDELLKQMTEDMKRHGDA